MEVRWNSENSRLFSPKPREFPDLDFSLSRCFRHIVAAARQQEIELAVETTDWSNIEPSRKNHSGRQGPLTPR
jgi:hypothetical protein